MRKVDDGGKTRKKRVKKREKIMSFIVATYLVASRQVAGGGSMARSLKFTLWQSPMYRIPLYSSLDFAKKVDLPLPAHFRCFFSAVEKK